MKCQLQPPAKERLPRASGELWLLPDFIIISHTFPHPLLLVLSLVSNPRRLGRVTELSFYVGGILLQKGLKAEKAARLGDSAGVGEGKNENREERKMAKHRPSLTGRTALFFLVGNGQRAGLDTDLLGMGKVHDREKASAGAGVPERVSLAPLCLTWSVVIQR